VEGNRFYVDVDTTDGFMDGREPRYQGGLTFWEQLEAKGYDLSDLGTLAAQIRARAGADDDDDAPSSRAS
jgi:hypothetical protein